MFGDRHVKRAFQCNKCYNKIIFRVVWKLENEHLFNSACRETGIFKEEINAVFYLKVILFTNVLLFVK